jgi:NADPH:quinone reductase-like Zn-dependent oxidoreductase
VKAIVQDRYGPPEVLQLREVDPPPIGAQDVLVRVKAASVNALDWHMTRGMPYLMRLGGLRKPGHRVRGVDLAGRVEAVGQQVTGFQPGDDVFGGSDGSFAEYAATPPARLALKPAGLSYEQAATLHVAALTALQGLRDKAQVRPGQRVLINGAGGGVGIFAVQIARWLGARVTAVTRTESVELVRSLGADEVIDHRNEDFTRRSDRYDALFDIGGNRALSECRRVLATKGVLVAIGGPPGRWLAPVSRLFRVGALSPFVSQRLIPLMSHNDQAGLALLAKLAAEGKVRPVVDRSYPLAQAADAVRYVGTGHPRGKVVINVP